MFPWSQRVPASPFERPPGPERSPVTASWTGASFENTLKAVKLPAALPVRVEFWREKLEAIVEVVLPEPRNWMLAVLPKVEIVPLPVTSPP